jgi:hypothetical protein
MQDWPRFLRTFLAVFLGGIGLAVLLVATMNPYGNLPVSLFREHTIMDINQRFQYPAIIRSGRYDSIVIGTSTSRLLEPRRLETAFGGRWANLAMNSATAWEQARLAELFVRTMKRPGTLLVALDHVWCAANADTERITPRGFPQWMFDDNPWNDLPYMLNITTVEIAGRRIGNLLGLNPARIPHDGYEVFVPPESEYDRAKVRQKLYNSDRARRHKPVVPAYAPTPSERAAWRFPALAWLDAELGRGWQRRVLAFMPLHVIAQPAPGSREAAREAECKARIAAIARRHGTVLVDFGIASQLTDSDDNYWDPLHYRVPIAARIVDETARALQTFGEAVSGDWRVLR